MAEKKAVKTDNKIAAELRENFGKGAARKLRVLGKIPAVLYGHGTTPVHLSLPGHEIALILRKSNAVLELDIAGENQLALVKDVQKDPVRQIIEHIDLIVIRKGEKVVVDVNVTVEGEPFSGTVAMLDANTISVEADATNIPERIIVSVEGLVEGTQIFAKDLELPAGASLITDADTLVINVIVPVDLNEDTEDTEAAVAE
ncbi:MAG: 50S ribosomal protein L25/general stress protein Ctc [Microbacteriaceae bacterium]|nr:50S ribosomal protein L25/general stress protein Ctc [Microbacteriaceae bacterium]